MFIDKKCSGHKKFQLPLDEISRFQLGLIRPQMYHAKSTQGKKLCSQIDAREKKLPIKTENLLKQQFLNLL